MQKVKRARKRALKHKIARIKKQELRERIHKLTLDIPINCYLMCTLQIIMRIYWEKQIEALPRDDKRANGSEGKSKLTLEERQYLYLWYFEGKIKSEIARRLKRNRSTISKELKRNWYAIQKYRNHPYEAAKCAQDIADKRQSVPRQKARIKDLEIRIAIEHGLTEGISPELISDRVLLELGKFISHETIYQWLYTERKDLIPYLKRSGKKYHKRTSERSRRAPRQPATSKTSIDKRPKAANDRMEFGHWEFDTIVSKQSSECLLVIQERVSRYFFVVKLASCSAKEVASAIISCLKPLGKDWVKSLTCDNGPENWCQDELKAAFGVEVYYCHPYCSSERGGVENRNGTLRFYYPKKTDFRFVSHEDLEITRQKLLNRPMKCLDYFTPFEVFTGQFQPIFKMAA